MTKIERLNPVLATLAAELGGAIYYRAKAWWLGPWDRQITYDVRGGWQLSMNEKAALAEEILRKYLAAREQPGWGTVAQRAARIIHGLRTETAPGYMARHYCYWRHESMDQGVLFRTPLAGTISASLELVGQERIEVERQREDALGLSWDALLDDLAAKAAEVYGSRP